MVRKQSPVRAPPRPGHLLAASRDLERCVRHNGVSGEDSEAELMSHDWIERLDEIVPRGEDVPPVVELGDRSDQGTGRHARDHRRPRRLRQPR